LPFCFSSKGKKKNKGKKKRLTSNLSLAPSIPLRSADPISSSPMQSPGSIEAKAKNKKPRNDDYDRSSMALPDEPFLLDHEETARLPLPGYSAVPSSISFSPDDRRIAFLLSPEGTLYRKVFTFDPASRRQEMVFAPPGGGLDEGSLSVEEKLRRERARERGLGVTKYEWRPRRSELGPRGGIFVPLPSGVCFLFSICLCFSCSLFIVSASDNLIKSSIFNP
jgi:hypothetical protein